jgi:hypothetical protein
VAWAQAHHHRMVWGVVASPCRRPRCRLVVPGRTCGGKRGSPQPPLSPTPSPGSGPGGEEGGAGPAGRELGGVVSEEEGEQQVQPPFQRQPGAGGMLGTRLARTARCLGNSLVGLGGRALLLQVSVQDVNEAKKRRRRRRRFVDAVFSMAQAMAWGTLFEPGFEPGEGRAKGRRWASQHDREVRRGLACTAQLRAQAKIWPGAPSSSCRAGGSISIHIGHSVRCWTFVSLL